MVRILTEEEYWELHEREMAFDRVAHYKTLLNDNFRIVDETGFTFRLNITSDVLFPKTQSIVVYEAASGDSGITINNGRLNETVTISGKILGRNQTQLLRKCEKLSNIKDEGEQVDFITPFVGIRGNAGNKFFIRELEYDATNSTPTMMPFTMTLVENREANVKTTSVNLVNYQTADFMKQYYFQIAALE